MKGKAIAGLGVLWAAALVAIACTRDRAAGGPGASAATDSGATRSAKLLPDSGTPGTTPRKAPVAGAPSASGSAQSSGGAARPTSGSGTATTDSARTAGSSSGAKRPMMRPPPPHDTSPRPVPRPQLPKPGG